MEFSDKLNFLMKVTQTSNKELAAEIAVDRSLISLLRNGKRGMPRNHDYIKLMALYFARRSEADYQRQALADMLGLAALRSGMPIEVLALQLERWLLGELSPVDRMVAGLQGGAAPIPTPRSAPPAVIPSEKTVFFYGEEGRRQAVRHLLTMLDDGPIWMDDNTDMSWMVSDYQFALDMQTEIRRHLAKENTFLQILPPASCMGSYVESLRFMLPVYASGHAAVYYHPRMQISPHAYSAIISPGRCVLYTTVLRGSSRGVITMVSADRELVNAHAEHFQEYLSRCRPALTVHRDPAEFGPAVGKLLSMRGAIFQKVAPLSSSTIPAELLEQCMEQTSNPVWKDAFRISLDNISVFEQRLSENKFLDIARLATAERVRSGLIPIGCPYMPYEGHPCYTPETYALHLKNILRLMDQYENYHFLPISPARYPGYNLLVNESNMALLMRGEGPPALMLELCQPDLVLACQEHLIRIAELDGPDGIRRERVRIQLNALIRELQS